jgi:Family of unknown function (DUF5330)
MFLIRAAFWLTIVIFLLPADPQGGQAPGVGALQALTAVEATATDVSGFCDRNPDVCATASTAGEIFSEKLRYGVELIQNTFASHADGAPADTLTSDDTKTPWRGVTRSGA